MAVRDDSPTNEISYEVRCLREVFRGRFENEGAQMILRHNGDDLQTAFNFILETSPEIVRQVSGEDIAWLTVLPNGRIRDLTIPSEIRQYGCGDCDNVWWRKVPTRKPFSKCRRCHRRFEPVPKDKEWGRAKFDCECGRGFVGFGSMDESFLSPCYHCQRMCRPTEILPPRRGDHQPRTRLQHSCNAHNCYNPSYETGPAPTWCVHPRSLNRKVVYPSQRHTSSGSTVTTFLSQENLVGSEYLGSRLSDISENSSDG